jgi:hypothetical protein
MRGDRIRGTSGRVVCCLFRYNAIEIRFCAELASDLVFVSNSFFPRHIALHRRCSQACRSARFTAKTVP